MKSNDVLEVVKGFGVGLLSTALLITLAYFAATYFGITQNDSVEGSGIFTVAFLVFIGGIAFLVDKLSWLGVLNTGLGRWGLALYLILLGLASVVFNPIPLLFYIVLALVTLVLWVIYRS